jgi:putative membrane protein
MTTPGTFDWTADKITLFVGRRGRHSVTNELDRFLHTVFASNEKEQRQMKKKWTTILLALAVVAALATACKSKNNENTSSTDTASNSTSVSASDTSGTTSTNPATSDTTGTATNSTAASGGTVSAMSQDDQKFVEKAAFGGLAEVSLGQQMSSLAKNNDAKAFAQRMVTDHSKANDELKQLATTKGITLPTDTDQKHKDAAQKVTSSKNPDKAYMSEMVKDHDEDVSEFEKESKSAKDPDLKAWVDKTLPVLKDHQKMAHDINGKMK